MLVGPRPGCRLQATPELANQEGRAGSGCPFGLRLSADRSSPGLDTGPLAVDSGHVAGQSVGLGLFGAPHSPERPGLRPVGLLLGRPVCGPHVAGLHGLHPLAAADRVESGPGLRPDSDRRDPGQHRRRFSRRSRRGRAHGGGRFRPAPIHGSGHCPGLQRPSLECAAAADEAG